MNLSIIPAAFDVLRKGSAVADDVKGRNWGALGGALGVLIYAAAQAAKLLGVDLPIDNDTAQHIGVGIASVAGVFVTYGTSRNVGILPAKPAAQVADNVAGQRDAPVSTDANAAAAAPSVPPAPDAEPSANRERLSDAGG